MKQYPLLFLLGICLIGIILRFYQLGSIPAGLTNDEVDKGYDAYSVLKTGHDQWDKPYPLLSFKGFGDFRPPVYTYFIVPAISLVGLTSLAVRLPSAIFGILSIVLMYLFIRLLIGKKEGLFAALLFAISPWAVGLNRFGLEVTVALGFLLAGFYFFIRFTKEKKYLWLYAAFFFFALTVYTYTAYTLFIPIALLLLCLQYRKVIFNKTILALGACLLFILVCLPLFTYKENGAAVRFSQVGLQNNITSIGVVNILNDERSSCITTSLPVLCKLVFNRPNTFFQEFINNYLHHFSLDFLYISGTPSQYSILPMRGLEYLPELCLLLFGILTVFTTRNTAGFLLIGLLFLSVVPDALTADGNYARASLMLPFLLSLEAIGFVSLLVRIYQYKNIFLQRSLLGLVCLVIFITVGQFFLTYITYFKTHYSNYSQYGYEQLMRSVADNQQRYDKIFISYHVNDTKQYIYYLFYTRYDSHLFQTKQNVSYSTKPDGWSSIDRIKNIYFVNKFPISIKNYANEKVLLIANPKEFVPCLHTFGNIKDLAGTTVFTSVTIHEYLKYTEQTCTIIPSEL